VLGLIGFLVGTTVAFLAGVVLTVYVLWRISKRRIVSLSQMGIKIETGKGADSKEHYSESVVAVLKRDGETIRTVEQKEA